MKKPSLKTVFLGSIPCLLIGCADVETAFVDDPNVGVDAAANQGEEPIVGDEPGDGQDLEPPVDEPEPFCGDGLIDDGEQCDDGNDDAGDGCSADCELEEIEVKVEGALRLTLTLDDLSSNTKPLENDCVDVVDVVRNGSELFVDGQCLLPANFIGVAGWGDVDEDGSVAGEITFTLNGIKNPVPFTGTLENGVLELEFSGVTLVGGTVRGIWRGTVDAELE